MQSDKEELDAHLSKILDWTKTLQTIMEDVHDLEEIDQHEGVMFIFNKIHKKTNQVKEILDSKKSRKSIERLNTSFSLSHISNAHYTSTLLTKPAYGTEPNYFNILDTQQHKESPLMKRTSFEAKLVHSSEKGFDSDQKLTPPLKKMPAKKMKEFSKLTKRLKELKDQYEEIKQDYNALEKDYEALEKGIGEKEQKIEELGKIIDGKNEDLKDCEKTNKQLKDSIGKLQKEIGDLRAKLELKKKKKTVKKGYDGIFHPFNIDVLKLSITPNEVLSPFLVAGGIFSVFFKREDATTFAFKGKSSHLVIQQNKGYSLTERGVQVYAVKPRESKSSWKIIL